MPTTIQTAAEIAARDGKPATACPYETGANRIEWLTAFFIERDKKICEFYDQEGKVSK